MATRGEEDGVPWQWTNNLGLNVAVGQAMAQVGVHELHQREVAGLHGNVFYGSFSVVNEFGHYYHHTQVLEAHPTKTAHTEPQYFEWLAAQVRSLRVGLESPRKRAAV